jgi:hypothetical protein
MTSLATVGKKASWDYPIVLCFAEIHLFGFAYPSRDVYKVMYALLNFCFENFEAKFHVAANKKADPAQWRTIRQDDQSDWI